MLAAGEALDRCFGGLRDNLSTRDALSHLCRAETTLYSWKHFHIGSMDGVPAGGVCMVPVDGLGPLVDAVPDVLRLDCRIGATGLLRLLARALRIGFGRGGDEFPAGGIFMPFGAVFPAHQGKGVGTAAFLAILEIARAMGGTALCCRPPKSNVAMMRVLHALNFEPVPSKRVSAFQVMALHL
ncbi:MAG: GNAT family N-acetyltransferase [Candidatus Hydrogenedentes bacterium]|nr:GNAT family N-acetyltransferase [Candidatus Hydrogenedentota bacterium]